MRKNQEISVPSESERSRHALEQGAKKWEPVFLKPCGDKNESGMRLPACRSHSLFCCESETRETRFWKNHAQVKNQDTAAILLNRGDILIFFLRKITKIPEYKCILRGWARAGTL